MSDQNMKPPPLSPVTAEEVADVLAHTEIIEAPGASFVLGPGVVFAIDEPSELRGDPEDMVQTLWGGSISWEVPVSEETFWYLIETFLGPAAVVEMKQDLEDMLVWEGEGGSCLA